jgi:hypothetical protein
LVQVHQLRRLLSCKQRWVPLLLYHIGTDTAHAMLSSHVADRGSPGGHSRQVPTTAAHLPLVEPQTSCSRRTPAALCCRTSELTPLGERRLRSGFCAGGVASRQRMVKLIGPDAICCLEAMRAWDSCGWTALVLGMRSSARCDAVPCTCTVCRASLIKRNGGGAEARAVSASVPANGPATAVRGAMHAC